MVNSTNDAVPLSGVPLQNNLGTSDTLLTVSNTYIIQTPITTAFSNVSINFNSISINSNTTPINSTSTANVVQGSIWSDSTYLYVGCPNNIVKRILLATF